MAIRVRRANVPALKSYQGYKRYLREDFAYGCVYCGVHENEAGGPRYFSVEHFRPKSLYRQLTTDYRNLLYACGICNSFKSNDWPSDDPLRDGKGYLDPCDHDYDKHFALDDDFFVAQTPVAEYMINRMHLNRVAMQKQRRVRRDDEALHTQFLMLFERSMAALDGLLAAEALPGAERRAMRRELEQLRQQYAQRVNAWEQRWQPRFGMDDYR